MRFMVATVVMQGCLTSRLSHLCDNVWAIHGRHYGHAGLEAPCLYSTSWPPLWSCLAAWRHVLTFSETMLLTIFDLHCNHAWLRGAISCPFMRSFCERFLTSNVILLGCVAPCLDHLCDHLCDNFRIIHDGRCTCRAFGDHLLTISVIMLVRVMTACLVMPGFLAPFLNHLWEHVWASHYLKFGHTGLLGKFCHLYCHIWASHDRHRRTSWHHVCTLSATMSERVMTASVVMPSISHHHVFTISMNMLKRVMSTTMDMPRLLASYIDHLNDPVLVSHNRHSSYVQHFYTISWPALWPCIGEWRTPLWSYRVSLGYFFTISLTMQGQIMPATCRTSWRHILAISVIMFEWVIASTLV